MPNSLQLQWLIKLCLIMRSVPWHYLIRPALSWPLLELREDSWLHVELITLPDFYTFLSFSVTKHNLFSQSQTSWLCPHWRFSLMGKEHFGVTRVDESVVCGGGVYKWNVGWCWVRSAAVLLPDEGRAGRWVCGVPLQSFRIWCGGTFGHLDSWKHWAQGNEATG